MVFIFNSPPHSGCFCCGFKWLSHISDYLSTSSISWQMLGSVLMFFFLYNLYYLISNSQIGLIQQISTSGLNWCLFFAWCSKVWELLLLPQGSRRWTEECQTRQSMCTPFWNCFLNLMPDLTISWPACVLQIEVRVECFFSKPLNNSLVCLTYAYSYTYNHGTHWWLCLLIIIISGCNENCEKTRRRATLNR